jgi:cytochrome P450
MLEAREAILPGALDGAPAWQAFLVRRFYGRWRSVMRAGLKLDGFDVAAARASIEEAFARVLAARPAGKTFLAGDAPGALDVIFAVLASPVLLPEGHSATVPPLAALPPDFRSIVEAYRASEAGGLAMTIFRTRPAPQPPMRRPRAGWSPAAWLTAAPVLRIAARLAARLAPRRIDVRGTVAVFRWHDVADVLDRDADFRIAPVNAARIEAVSGPFILGMDRSAALFAQRAVAYGALRAAGAAGVRRALSQAPARVAAAAARHGAIEVVNGYARPIAARSAAALFGIPGPSEAQLMRVARAVFHETFLNLGGDAEVRAAGIAAGRQLRGWIDGAAAERRAAGRTGNDLLGALLDAEARGEIDAGGVAHVLAGLLVGAIDTTATAVAHVMAELVADRRLLVRVQADRENPARLGGWCSDILRQRPHNPILLRRAAPGAMLCGRPVPPGANVVAVTIAAMQDARVFDKPSRCLPDRPPQLYLHFGRGLHLCAGRDINALQVPQLVAGLLRFEPLRKGPLRQRGPFADELVIGLGVPA